MLCLWLHDAGFVGGWRCVGFWGHAAADQIGTRLLHSSCSFCWPLRLSGAHSPCGPPGPCISQAFVCRGIAHRLAPPSSSTALSSLPALFCIRFSSNLPADLPAFGPCPQTNPESINPSVPGCSAFSTPALQLCSFACPLEHSQDFIAGQRF